jgi:capsular polysaccharide transport system ATP-binding protein
MVSRVIHLVSVAKSYWTPRSAPKIVLQPTTLTLPADRRLAVLGKKRQGKSVFLRMLAGAEIPTEGEVIARMRSSPVVKSGALFHSRLSNRENIRCFARMLNLDGDLLTLAIDAFCGGCALAKSPKDEDREWRSAAEMALLSIIPFDCYFVDDIGQFAKPIRERHLDTIAQRRAGIIFTTNQPSLARDYADCAVVIRDGIVHPFPNVAEAIAFDER